MYLRPVRTSRPVLRFANANSSVMCLRFAQRPVTLQDGFLLKRGTRIAFPAQLIHFDPNNYEVPQEFRPFRFAGSGPYTCEPDAGPSNAGRVKADALDEKYLPFGFGKQACPGRFFAMKVVKLILGRLLYEYNIKWCSDPPASPISGSMEGFFLPAKNVQICLKSRHT